MLVDYNNFGNGNTISVFDLTARCECNSEQFTVRKLKNVRINLKYSNALTETNSLIFMVNLTESYRLMQTET